jgi:hypothetical protein
MVLLLISMVSDAGRRPKQDTIKIGRGTILSAPQCRTLIWDPYFPLGAALIRSMTQCGVNNEASGSLRRDREKKIKRKQFKTHMSDLRSVFTLHYFHF